MTEVLHNYFEYKARLMRRELRQLLQQGRISLMIGIAFLALCLLSADAIGKLATGPFLSIVRESLTIGGWVGMWRPLQIFLYDWWPLTRSCRTYQDLSRAEVRITGPVSLYPASAIRADRPPDSPASGSIPYANDWP